MRGFLISLILLSSILLSFGDTSYNTEIFKQLVSSVVNDKVTPSNAKSCSDVGGDVAKCNSNVNDCGSLQSYANCIWDAVYKDCGSDKAKQYCDTVNANIAPTITGCNNFHCAASSVFISGSIGALLFYKMVLEKFFFNL